ncbi:MAG: amidohydrolase [Clostridiales Family XIII bacterium]|jgi:predicted amidohydrolase YtcJ|nr:amidohydrolase [Clostridiales Family XIII bacterium]
MRKLFYNGVIHTMNGDETTPSVTVEDGVVVALGESPEGQPDGVGLEDLRGMTVLPGFHDSHMHFLNYAIDKEKVELSHCRGLEDMARATREYIEERELGEGDWIQGGGWNENNFREAAAPNRQDLDAMSGGRPMIFTRACCSVAVANTAALRAAGIFEAPPQLDDGRIALDENGVPTGLLEERARFLVYDKIPKIGKNAVKRLILDYQKDLLKAGLTTVQTDDFKLWDAGFRDVMDAYSELDAAGQLKLRFILQARLVDEGSLDDFLRMGLKTGDGGDYYKIGAYKLLPDGSLGGKTAALRESYIGEPGNRGILTYARSELYSLLEKAHLAGMQLATHAIGDRAMDMVLDCYEELARKHPSDDPRFRVIHCQITTEDIMDRFRALGALADIQPMFIHADMRVCEALIGEGRTKWSYNWKTLLEKGVRVSGSSDAPVEPFDPLYGIYAAVTRKDMGGHPDGGWLPEQKLSLREAIELYTGGAAYTSYEEGRKGRLSPGYLADFVVLGEDIFSAPEDHIKDIRVARTYVGGSLAHDADIDG